MTQKWLPGSQPRERWDNFWVNFRSVWGRSARVTFESLLGQRCPTYQLHFPPKRWKWGPQNLKSGWAGRFREIQVFCAISTETLGLGNSRKFILGTPFWWFGELRMAQVDMLGRGDLGHFNCDLGHFNSFRISVELGALWLHKASSASAATMLWGNEPQETGRQGSPEELGHLVEEPILWNHSYQQSQIREWSPPPPNLQCRILNQKSGQNT